MPGSAPLYAKALLHLGSRAAIDQALSRLASGAAPACGSRALCASRRDAAWHASAKRAGGARSPDGYDWRNDRRSSCCRRQFVGAHHSVPVRTIYLTSGPSRRLNFGTQTFELQHGPRWQLSLAGRPAGDAIRALAWLGRRQSRAVTSKLGKALSTQTLNELSAVRRRRPTWMAQQISMLVLHG
jgi:hypothetical protein